MRTAWKRIAGWVAPALEPELAGPFEQECAARNRRRLLGVAPLVVLLHTAHVVAFRNGAHALATLGPDVLRWRAAVVEVHAVTLVILAALIVIGLKGSPRAIRWLGPAAVLTYVVHGAVIAGVDQISIGSGVAPFVGYCLFMAVVVSMRPTVAVTLYAIGLAVFVPALFAMQPNPALRLAQLANGLSVAAVSVVLAGTLYAARVREFSAQAIIERQRGVLAELNASLERRVDEQVAVIVTRAKEIEGLNAQLQTQVRERSTELSLALARLAEQRDASDHLPRGTRIGGRFDIGEPLGAGGMGVVYAGTDRMTGSRVAIKVVRARSSTQLEAARRFLREATAAATVTHPAIVRVLHVDITDDGLLYQAQELVDGESLQRALERGRKWSVAEVAVLGATLAGALAAAHRQGIVHRDVKPSNVMLTREPPGLKLVDFGIAKLYEPGPAEGAAGGTLTGSILGTPAFMAPEQIEGARTVTARADVYAVGVVLFTLLAGRHPFDEKTPWGIAYSHMCVEPPDVADLDPTVPAPLCAIVARCLRKSPDDRPTAEELAASLGA